MKMKLSFIAPCLILLMFLMLGGCHKKMEPIVLKNALPGTWYFESFKLDTMEHMGITIQSAFVRFDPLVGNSSNFHQEVTMVNSGTDTLVGTYELLEEPNTVRMMAEEKTNVVTLSIDPKDKLKWVAVQDGKPITVIAKRRK